MMKHNLSGGEKAGKDVVFDRLPRHRLEEAFPKALNICEEHALRVIDLDEAGDGHSKCLSSASQQSDGGYISISSKRFKIAHTPNGNTSLFRYRLDCCAAREHVQAAVLPAAAMRAGRIERDVSNLTRSSVVPTIELAVDVVGTTDVSS